jgi:hypothetical protein
MLLIKKKMIIETKYHPQPMTTMVPETINHIRYNTVVVPGRFILIGIKKK